MRKRIPGLLLLLFLPTAGMTAQLRAKAFDPDRQIKTVAAMRVESPPRIDGILDDAVWSEGNAISDFRQTEPDDGQPASERTEFRICYDSKNLYFGIRAWESEPRRLVRSLYERDGFMPADDSILLAIDSNHDNRTAYIFEMNTLGARTDIEVSEQGSFNIDWDPIWNYTVRLDDEGYSIEAVIPFFVLRFNRSKTVDMGFLIKRRIRKNNEHSNWPYLSRDYAGIAFVSQYGTITGLRGIERGKSVEIKPYGIAGYSASTEESDYQYDAGVDVKWGISSGLTADLTANPDFAQVESDALQVNLTRFSLFFPEKREFFLERSDLFQFGLPQRAEVFFSRRIGIHDDQQIPITAGTRVYGLLGQTNVGFLTMQTNETAGLARENFTVGRVKHNVLGRSYVGGILTSRQGNGIEKDVTAGGDFMLLFDNNLRFHGLLTRSSRPGTNGGEWFGSVGTLQMNDRYNWEFRYDDIGENFDPGIGFVMRPDQRTLTGWGEWTPRPSWESVRQLRLGLLFRHIENHEGLLETRRFQFKSELDLESDDSVHVIFNHQYEFVPDAFEIAPDIEIPSGAYRNIEGAAGVATSRSRRLSGRFDVYRTTFYEGHIQGVVFGASARPFPWLHFNLEEDHSNVTVPTGHFKSSISRLFISYFLNPDLSTRVAAQYSSLFEDFVLNFRLRWIYAPGSELWLVYNEGRNFELRGTPTLEDRALILKIVHNFNF